MALRKILTKQPHKMIFQGARMSSRESLVLRSFQLLIFCAYTECCEACSSSLQYLPYVVSVLIITFDSPTAAESCQRKLPGGETLLLLRQLIIKNILWVMNIAS